MEFLHLRVDFLVDLYPVGSFNTTPLRFVGKSSRASSCRCLSASWKQGTCPMFTSNMELEKHIVVFHSSTNVTHIFFC